MPDERKPFVLIVDDDADILALFARALGLDFRVDIAGDGFTALQKIRTLYPDVLVLDMAMPGKSGLAVLQEIRADENFKTLPVVVVSAVDPASDLWKGVDHAWDSYVRKPADTDELISTIKKVLVKGPAARKKAPRKPPGKTLRKRPGRKSAG